MAKINVTTGVVRLIDGDLPDGTYIVDVSDHLIVDVSEFDSPAEDAPPAAS